MSTRRKLLIAEDNEADVFLIREALNLSGLDYDAEVASNGESALERVDEIAGSPGASIDAILLDLNLTTHSGLEILEHVRGTPAFDDTRIIILTSSDSPGDRQRASDLGSDLYIRKPMDFDEFMQVGRRIADLLTKGEQTATST